MSYLEIWEVAETNRESHRTAKIGNVAKDRVRLQKDFIFLKLLVLFDYYFGWGFHE